MRYYATLAKHRGKSARGTPIRPIIPQIKDVFPGNSQMKNPGIYWGFWDGDFFRVGYQNRKLNLLNFALAKNPYFQASDGKRKISTVVNGEELPGFQSEYCKLLRANMNGLPKRPKKKKTAVDN